MWSRWPVAPTTVLVLLIEADWVAVRRSHRKTFLSLSLNQLCFVCFPPLLSCFLVWLSGGRCRHKARPRHWTGTVSPRCRWAWWAGRANWGTWTLPFPWFTEHAYVSVSLHPVLSQKSGAGGPPIKFPCKADQNSGWIPALPDSQFRHSSVTEMFIKFWVLIPRSVELCLAWTFESNCWSSLFTLSGSSFPSVQIWVFSAPLP